MPKKTTRKVLRKPHSIAWKALGAAVVSAAMLGSAGAAGLGQLTVMSALGQPLLAEIELTSVTPEEAGNLSVRLAPQQAFRQANIEFNAALNSLRFAIEQRGSRRVIKITSTQAMNEPFVDVLLEVSSAGNRLLREYVVLLDPAGMRRAQPAETPAMPAPAATAQAQNQSRPANAAAQQASTEKSGAGGDTYPVKRGDTLASIANQIKPEGVSLDQMLVALQRANPNAFAGNNINRLRSGQILTVPGAETARSLGTAEAHRIVIAQSADFNSYRERLAGQIGGADAGQGEDSGQLGSGKITSRVEEQRNPAAESRDRLQVSRSAAAGADAEERIAQEKALAEANSRLRELEKTVGDLRRLLEVRNGDLAARQNQAVAAAAPAATGAALAAAPQAGAEKPAAATNPAPAATPAGTPLPVDAAPAPSASSPAPAPAAAAAAPAKAKPRPAPVAPAPEPGLIEDLTNNPVVVGGSALLLALLAALGIGRARKAKAGRVADSSHSIMPTSTLKTNSLFAATGGQSVDTANSVFNSNFSPSASQLDTNEVDPVAEADVYIAYGRDAQAEEILKEALRTQPDRTAVRGKLLEIYAARKDLRAFETAATELFSLTKGEGEEWAQAAALGMGLDPGNPLYASARKPADPPADMPAAAPAVATGAMAAAAATAKSHHEEPESGLDFDALLNTTQNLQEIHTDAGHAKPASASAEALIPPVEAAAAPVAPAQPEPEPESNLLDFDFDLDSFGKGAAPAKAAPAADALSADSRLMDFNLDSVDLPAAHEPDPLAASPGDEDEFPPLELDAPGTAARPATAPQGQAPIEFDLSSINLDLEPHAKETAVLDDVPTLGEQSYSNTAEMATKLDLASAYQEIGDHEGARELLEEVIKGGDSEQSEKAKALLLKLA